MLADALARIGEGGPVSPGTMLPTLRVEQEKAVALECLLRGMNPSQTASALRRRGFSCTDAKARGIYSQLKREMRENRLTQMDERFDQELAILEHIRAKALISYDLSMRDTETRETTEEVPVLPAPLREAMGTAQGGQNIVPPEHPLARALNGELTGQRTEKRKVTGQSGDPNHLKVALAASSDIRKMLKVDPEEVKRIEFINRGIAGHTPAQLESMDPAELARLVDQEITNAAGT